jgi:hypothetical protein
VSVENEVNESRKGPLPGSARALHRTLSTTARQHCVSRRGRWVPVSAKTAHNESANYHGQWVASKQVWSPLLAAQRGRCTYIGSARWCLEAKVVSKIIGHLPCFSVAKTRLISPSNFCNSLP